MTATLRPMNLGEILDCTFEIYRKRLLLFVGLAAFPAFAMMGVHLADALWWHVSTLVRPFRQPGIFLWIAFVSLGFYHIRNLVGIPFAPALVNSASKAAFGEQDSIAGTLRATWTRLRSYLWVGILKLIAELLIPEILAAAVMAGIGFAADAAGWLNDPSTGPIILLTLPFFLLIALFLWLSACFSLAFPAAVFEQRGAIKAMRRSWNLSKNSRGRIVALWLMILVAGWLMMFGLQFIFRRAMSAYGWRYLGPAWRNTYFAGAYILNAIVIALLDPLFSIAITLIYYDQRIRREGFDIEMLMEAAGLSDAEALVPPLPSALAE